jgi:hypothetical protein
MEGDTRPIVFEMIWPQMVVDDRQFFIDEESTPAEQQYLSGLTHFGIRVLWGLTGEADPSGNIWPSTQYRPVIPVLGCVPAAEA